MYSAPVQRLVDPHSSVEERPYSGTHRKALGSASPNQPLQATAKSGPRLSGRTLRISLLSTLGVTRFRVYLSSFPHLCGRPPTPKIVRSVRFCDRSQEFVVRLIHRGQSR